MMNNRIFINVLALFSAFTVWGKYGGTVELDHPDGFYRSGETVHCKVLLTKDG